LGVTALIEVKGAEEEKANVSHGWSLHKNYISVKWQPTLTI